MIFDLVFEQVLASNQMRAFVFYCSSVHERMVGASTDVYEFSSLVRDKRVWLETNVFYKSLYMDATH